MRTLSRLPAIVLMIVCSSAAPNPASAQGHILIDQRPCSDPASTGYPCPAGVTVPEQPQTLHQATVQSAGPMTFNANFITTYCPVTITVKKPFTSNWSAVESEYRLERWVAGAPWEPLVTQRMRTGVDHSLTAEFTFVQDRTYNGLLRIVTRTPESGLKPDPLVDSTRNVPFSVVCSLRPQPVAVRALVISPTPASAATSSGACPYSVHFTVSVTTDPLPAGVDGDVRVLLTGATGSHPMAHLLWATPTTRTYDVVTAPLGSERGLMTAVASSINQVSGSTPYHITCTSTEGKEKVTNPRAH